MKRPVDFVNDLLKGASERKWREIVNQVGRNTLAEMVLELARIVDNKDRQLELMETHQEVMSDFAMGGVEKTEARIQSLKDKIKSLQSEMERLKDFAPYGPPKLEIPPTAKHQETFTITLADDEGTFIMMPADQGCWVTFSIRIIHGKRWEQTTIIKDGKVHPLYPGDKDSLASEIDNRILPILRRSPTIDDIPDWQQLWMVPKEKLVQAMMSVALARYTPAINHDYQETMLEAFDYHIKPYISNSDELTEDAAKGLFRKITDKSYEIMEERRNIPDSKSQLPVKAGRPRRRDQEVEQLFDQIKELAGKTEPEQIRQFDQTVEELKERLAENQRLT